MMEELKKIMLAGIGSVAYTYEKASVLIDEMVEKGRLTMEEGKDLTQELKRNVRNAGEVLTENVIPMTRADLKSILEEMNLVSKEELDELKIRVSCLESKLAEKENQ